MPDLNTGTPNTPDMTTSGASGGTTEGIMNQATTVLDDIATDLKSRASDVTDTITSEARNYADRAKGTIADEVETVASALRTAADEMSRGSASERTFSQIANGLADASDAMRDKDLGQIVGVLSDFAKRNPLVFLGGAALVGFAATRFAKASSEGAHPKGSMSLTGQYDRKNAPAFDNAAAGSAMASPAIQSPAINRSTDGGW